MEKGKKRKRDLGLPRIAYHTSTRSFDRLLKEESLDGMKETVRRKLGLGGDTAVSLSQIREDKTVDLEDDDDFDAFYTLAHSAYLVDVKVTIGSSDNGTAPSGPVEPNNSNDNGKTSASSRLSAVKTSKNATGAQFNEKTGDSGAAVEIPRAQNVVIAVERERKKRRIIIDAVHPTRDSIDNTSDQDPTVPVPSTNFSSPSILRISDEAEVPTPTSVTAPTGEDCVSKKRGRQGIIEEQSPISQTPTELRPKTKKKKERRKIDPLENTTNSGEVLVGSISESLASNDIVAEGLVGSLDASKDRQTKLKTHGSGNIKESRKTRSKPTSNLAATGQGDHSIGYMIQDELERDISSAQQAAMAFEADVDNSISRMLAAKRASLAGTPDMLGQKSSTHNGNVKKKKSIVASRVHTSSPPERQTPQPLGGSGGSSTCPLCLLSPSHSRKECPLVSGSTESIQRRLSELQASAVEGHVELVADLRKLLKRRKNKAAKPETNAVPPLSSPQTQPSAVLHSIVSEVSEKHPVPLSIKPHKSTEGNSKKVTSRNDTSGDKTDKRPFTHTFPHERTHLDDIDLDVLIQGPKLRVADMVLPESSVEESDEEPVQLLEEDESEPRRRSRNIDPSDSSGESESSSIDEGSSIAKQADDRMANLALSSGVDGVPSQTAVQEGVREAFDASVNADLGPALVQGTTEFDVGSAPQGTRSGTLQPSEESAPLAPPSPAQMTTSIEAIILPPPATHPALLADSSASASKSVVSTPLIISARSASEDDTRELEAKLEMTARMKTRIGKSPNNTANMSGVSTPSQVSLTQESQDKPGVGRRQTRSATRGQLIETSTPALPARLGRQSRLISGTDSNLNTPSNTQNGTSKNTWAAFRQPTLTPDMEPMVMIDELEPSSPLHLRAVDAGTPDTAHKDGSQGRSAKSLEHFHTESQTPFLNTPLLNDVSQNEGVNDPRSNDSDDENEVENVVQKSKTKAKPRAASKFRRLTEIASELELFSTPKYLRPASTPRQEQEKVTDMYGRSKQDEIESESESGSGESEAEEPSHIPKLRRAGVLPTKKKETDLIIA